MAKKILDYDFIIIGSGFGGSVSALRLSEKGYRVLVIEKGKWYSSSDFPKTNWHIKKWLWVPLLRFFGFFKISYFKHISILSGVGVGGGSLMYANTLPVPRSAYFKADSWAHLADWENELAQHYRTAQKMLGAATNPKLQTGDLVLQRLADALNKKEHFKATEVAVFFGEAEKTVPDPYFGGQGPERSGCTFCGGCMTGCRYNAKNTLDKNYLYLAQKKGAEIQAESKVIDIKPTGDSRGADGYRVWWHKSTAFFRQKKSFTAQGIILAGGVLGTVPLLLKLKEDSLPYLSDKVGCYIRTNSESLTGITVPDKSTVFSDGIAIGSILHTDVYSHLEPVRYAAGSGAWRLLLAPLIQGPNFFIRAARLIADLVSHPVQNLKVYFVDDWAKRTQILLFMQTINSTLRFIRSFTGMKSRIESGENPPTFIPEARELAERYARLVGGKPTMLLTESLFGIPLTAHILGGAVMGQNQEEGVIDRNNHVFGYQNMFICDGSMISANPGVNPALTITALTERAMSLISHKGA
jgi:cholesterol oxidase